MMSKAGEKTHNQEYCFKKLFHGKFLNRGKKALLMFYSCFNEKKKINIISLHQVFFVVFKICKNIHICELYLVVLTMKSHTSSSLQNHSWFKKIKLKKIVRATTNALDSGRSYLKLIYRIWIGNLIYSLKKGKKVLWLISTLIISYEHDPLCNQISKTC